MSKKVTNAELEDLQFDAQLMGFRVVYIKKPLDDNHFVLYRTKPELQHVAHCRRLNDVRIAMQKYYTPS
jgi:hypothetical protein